MRSELSDRDIFAQAEKLIVAGSIREAAKLLEQVSPDGLSRNNLLTLVQLLRRTGLYETALKLLVPFVRPKKVSAPATPAERAEYAICLQRLGSSREAAQLLETVNPAEAPEALLYRAILSFSDWNYFSGIQPLQELIKTSAQDSYLARVGQLNLSAAYLMTGEYQKADELLGELTEKLKSRGEKLLLCNAFEVWSQLDILTNRLERADEHLKAAESILTGIKTLDRLWLMKWRAVREAMATQSLDPLAPVQAEALRKGHWETLRDLDFHRLRVRFDQKLYRRLYFGTNSVFYRDRLKSFFPGELIPKALAFYPDGRVLENLDGAIDLYTDFKDELSAGALPHALMMLLFSDWYKRFRTGHLYAILFKNEYFNPETSLNRVHQVVKRLREAMQAQMPNFDIDHDPSGYRMDFDKIDRPIKIEADRPSPDPDQIRIHLLATRRPGEFDSSDVQEILTLSRSAANKLIKSWRDERLIDIVGSGKTPRYKPVKK